MIDLPRLSNAELAARFGSDEAALRRYRMLAALLREGRRPGEVAQSFGVSRESLRRLRHAFARQGLAALESRPRGGGHVAQDSPLALAIRQELYADPQAAPAALWRRVQARLREQGLPRPRSTFYRLLPRLRDEEPPAGERATMAVLREALAALLEDPPVALGRGTLAAQLLPDLRDPLQRGRQLQRALRAAIERLRPAEAGPLLDDPRWRHYLIVAGEYETGEKRPTLQAALALSASTYSRAKREALERLVTLLPTVLTGLPPLEPPVTLIAPPPPPASFDHELELEQYILRLRRDGLAIVWGPAGVGTQGLAATLAARLRARGQKVVWHTCHQPDAEHDAGLGLLNTLGAALARDGRPALWERLSAPEPDDMARYLALLDELLAGRHWTLVIAKAHWMQGSLASQIHDVLMAARARRDLRLMLVGRSLPVWADPLRWPPLPFPSDTAARHAFLQRLDDQPAPTGPVRLPLASLRERAAALLDALAADSSDTPSDAQLARILDALGGLLPLADDLRNQLTRR